MRLILYTGKGGVGKTTTAAATAVCAAQRGRRTLVASADAAHSLGDVLETRLGPEPRAVTSDLPLDAMEVDARTEMERSWGAVRDYLVSIFRYQGIEEVVAEELALLPGAEELATLLAIESYASASSATSSSKLTSSKLTSSKGPDAPAGPNGPHGPYDLIVVDCAPTDSALRLLTLPEVARGAFRLLLRVQQALSTVVTPLARSVLAVPLPDAAVFRDAEQLLFRRLRALRRLVTGDQASVRLVVTPERMVIDEAMRAHTDLALFELPCDAVVMNRLLPEAAVTEAFFQDWGRLQEDRRTEVEQLFAPVPVLTGPLQDDEVTGLERLGKHGEQLFRDVEPDAVLSRAPQVRFRGSAAGGYRVDLPLPHAELDPLEVSKVDDELVICTGARRRTMKLPRRIASLDLSRARFRNGHLVVHFAAEAVSEGPEV